MNWFNRSHKRTYRSRLSKLWLKTLENRTVPAPLAGSPVGPTVSLMGPHTGATQLWLEARGGDLWQFSAQAPIAKDGQVSYLNLKASVPSQLNLDAMVEFLSEAPMEQTPGAIQKPLLLVLPRPDGTFAQFKIWEYSMMEPALSAQFPTFRTYQGQGLDDPHASIHLDVTSLGMHVQVFSPNGGWYIDPHWQLQTGYYDSYYRKDLAHEHVAGCTWELTAPTNDDNQSSSGGNGGQQQRFTNAGTLRTFRAAIAATGEYTAQFGGTQAGGQAAIVTMMNRINQIYENELAIRMTLVGNNNTIVYVNAGTDPYTDGDTNMMVNQNQTKLDEVIGTANYDIGHVVGQAGNRGFAPGRVGVAGTKAQGATTRNNPSGDAFWVDFVAHEIGHQFSARHTFNNSGDNSQRTANSAFEPGSGSTIMSYAGISGADNVQANSDPYFHAHSLEQIIVYINSIPNVGTKTANGNFGPGVSTPPNAVIPTGTPFSVQIQAYDGNSDPLVVTIEQRDLGPAQPLGSPDNGSSPLFRSFAPSPSWIRYFPQLSTIVSNTPSITEVLPSTNRTMKFTATARDNRPGGGSFDTNDLIVQTVNTGAPFQVTSFNSGGEWSVGTKQTITWDVAGTTGNGINTSKVDIELSLDGGLTYPITLAYNSPNDGSQEITVPNNLTKMGRVKVHGVKDGWRTFFDINNANISIGNGNLRGAGLTAKGFYSTLRPNQLVNFDFKVSNLSSVTIGDFDVGFYASKDQYITPSDPLLGVVNMPPIAGNTTVNPGANFKLPSHTDTGFWGFGDGLYYVGMIVDYNNKIGETNEFDNSNNGIGTDKATIVVTQTSDDAYEQNDSKETASKVLQSQPGVWLSSISGKAIDHDSDFYKFIVLPQTTALAHISVEVTYDNAPGTAPLLAGLQYPPLYFSGPTSTGTNGQIKLDYYGEPGDYYLVMGDFYGPTGNPYDVKWTVGPDLRGAYVSVLKAGVDDDPILANERLAVPVNALIADFSDPLQKASAEAPANWILSLDGIDISDQISSIKYEEVKIGFNPTRYEVTLGLAAPIGAGLLEVKGLPGILDADGNSIDGNGDGTPGDEFARSFRVSIPSLQGGELGINQTTIAAQRRPAIAMADNGNYVTVWEGYGQDGDGATESNIYARQFKANGTPIGPEFLINQYTTGEQSHPAISADANGNFLIAWQSAGQDGDGFGIFARRYNADGTPIGAEFKGVQFGTAGNQQHPAVALNADGSFTIVYESNEKAANGYDILVLGAGSGVGTVFYPNLNQYTTGNQTMPSIAATATGQFLVTWQSENSDGSGLGVAARGFNKYGAFPEFKVNTTTALDQFAPSVDIDVDGDAVIAWVSQSQDGDGDGIYARRFEKSYFNYDAKSGEFLVNETTTGSQNSPSVAIDADGDTVISWQSDLQDGDGFGIFHRRFSLLGEAQGAEALVNTYTTANQSAARIATDFDGDYVLAWQSADQDGDGDGVFAQRYGEPPPPPTVPTVSGSLAQVDAAGGIAYTFSLTVNDDNGVDVSTLDSSDVRVTGPNGFDVLATFDNVDNNTNGTPRIATYSFTPPGGDWDITDNGPYVVSVEADQIGDIDLLFALAGTVETFQVIIPDVTAPTITPTLVDVMTAGDTTYTLTLEVGDDIAVDVTTLDDFDLRVTGPNGFDVLATFQSVDDPTNGTPRIATYEFDAPGGDWDLVDNGLYSVSMELNQIADISSNYAADGLIGTFNVLIPDQNVPTASGTFDDVTTAGASIYTFTVTYADDDAVDVATLGTDDVFVTGPNGFESLATFDGVDVNTNGTPRVATYSFIVPGGAWSAAGNGTYTISLQTDQVGDVTGNLAASAEIGTFEVDIPDTTAPTAVGTFDDVTSFGVTEQLVTIIFTDDIAVDVSTLDDLDIRITGPGGFDVPAKFVSVDVNTNGSPRLATYSFTPPDGSWNQADNGTYSVELVAGEVEDTSGNAAVAGVIGQMTVAIAPASSVDSWQINDGSPQRSRVTSLTITFDSPVTLPTNMADAFELRRIFNNDVVNLEISVSGNDVTLSFAAGPAVDSKSLADGLYKLTIFKSQINNGNFDSIGSEVAGDDYIIIGNAATNKLYRLFGDGDGDGAVTSNDFALFRQTFGTGINLAFDFGGDGNVDANDFADFRRRFGISFLP